MLILQGGHKGRGNNILWGIGLRDRIVCSPLPLLILIELTTLLLIQNFPLQSVRYFLSHSPLKPDIIVQSTTRKEQK